MIGIHDIRICNFAFLDILFTVLFTIYLHLYIFKKKYSPFLITFIIIFLFVFIHYIFRINTTLNYKLGLSKKPTRYRDNYNFIDIISSE